MLLARCGESLHLYRRPDSGIWRGLWSLPEYDSISAAENAAQALGHISERETLPAITHQFTHYTLHITPLAVTIAAPVNSADWLATSEALAKGLPAPVRRLISTKPAP